MNETESLHARIASLEAELASYHKRRAAIEAMEAYKAHAATHAQDIAHESSVMFARHSPPDYLFPFTSRFLALRDEADRLRKEARP